MNSKPGSRDLITLQTWVTLGVTISVSEPASSVNLRNSWRRRRSIGSKEGGNGCWREILIQVFST